MDDLFPYQVNKNTSVLHSLHSNTDNQQISHVYTRHTYPPAARLPRIVRIPLINKFSFPTRLVRLEFDHSTVNYYSEIDTVTLSGKILPRNLIESNDQQNIPPSSPDSKVIISFFFYFLLEFNFYILGNC